MGVRTGNPRGRPKGAKSRSTVEREAKMREMSEALAQTLPEFFDGDAHALLMSIYKDGQRPIEVRLDAAKAAIRYEKPSLQAVVVSGEADSPLHLTVTSGVPRA